MRAQGRVRPPAHAARGRNVTIPRPSCATLPPSNPLFQHPRVFATRVVAVALLGALSLSAHPEIEGSLARLNTAIAERPADAELYLQRGELYARHEEWVHAEANYLRASELDPRLPRLAQARGALELAAGRPASALPLLDHALALDDKDAAALVLRARAHRALKAKTSALADLEAALALLPAPPPELFLERAALLPAAEAIRSLDDGIARLGEVVTLHLRALALEESIGRIDAALARLDRLAAESERQEPWLKRRGDFLTRAGRNAEARSAYAAALAAIAALPAWLRESPDTVRLAAELAQLTAPRS